MAANKVNKAKGKYDKSKSTSIMPSNDETEEYDFSLLRKPIQTSITGLGQARKIFDLATEELKKLLSDECDVLYECKVCRNIFRSLANFISHKRVYCKDTFDSNQHGHFIQQIPTHVEMKKIQQTEQTYNGSQKNNAMEDDDNERIPLTKDLTTIIEKIRKKKSCYINTKDFQVALQEIPTTSVAVFQNLENGLEKDSENMLNQVSELDKIMSKDMGVMQSDGNFKIESSADVDNNVIQISDDEESTDIIELKCKICDMQFSTQKTLKFHMKYKHVESRLVYPCPDCVEIFSTSWSVYRHLFKVHRKSAAQIRRQRESIQAKAFKMNNPPAFYERRKNNQKAPAAPKITEEERIEQENQAWMDNMEFDGEISRCGGCGRTFERRAALAAHTHTCQPRNRALSRRPETKRIEIQIRKDYNKGPNANLNLLKQADCVEKIKEEPIDETVNEITEKDEIEQGSLEKEPLEKDDVKKESLDKDIIEKEPVENEIEKEPMEVDANIDENSVGSPTQQSETETKTTETPEEVEPQVPPETTKAPPYYLPYAQQAEKSNLVALRQRIVGDIELDKLKCKRCNTHCEHIRMLYDHVAEHYKWMRYACKLCNFKHYYFEQLPDHVKTVHKLKGDKDFYFSTVKAIDGPEATELSEDPIEDTNEDSPESRRPSRCSSDSSRLSDDSSSSGVKVDNSRKRKVQQNSRYGKRKRESLVKTKEDGADENDSSNQKTYEENSSDIDYDVCDKIEKRPVVETSSVASRRPVRRKAKPKNADFEYDLSNLLKMEAQGYRENQTSNSTNNKQGKKKQADVLSFEILNKECLGAMDTMSRKAVSGAKAEMRTSNFAVYSHKEKFPPNVFARPMLPRTITKGDKNSPKKDINEDKDNSPSKENKNKSQNEESPVKDETKANSSDSNNANKEQGLRGATYANKTINKEQSKASNSDDVSPAKDSPTNPNTSKVQTTKTKTLTSVVPIKFRRQSIDVMKNPLINQNIKEFTKAGMKTKILVIKPIKVKDGSQSANTPLKFQTIKLKDPNRKTTGEDASSDQVVVVKVPNVERNIVLAAEKQKVNAEKIAEATEKSTETVTVATNGQIESDTTTAIGCEKDKSENSDISLLCEEKIKKVELTSAENKEIAEKVDYQTTTSNGIS